MSLARAALPPSAASSCICVFSSNLTFLPAAGRWAPSICETRPRKESFPWREREILGVAGVLEPPAGYARGNGPYGPGRDDTLGCFDPAAHRRQSRLAYGSSCGIYGEPGGDHKRSESK